MMFVSLKIIQIIVILGEKMDSQQSNQDPRDASPTEKKKTVRYITLAVILFLFFVLIYMALSVKPEPEELPINNNPTVAETES